MPEFYANAFDAAPAKFKSVEADGLDQDSLDVHCRAEARLAARGVFNYTADEYLEACNAVMVEKYAAAGRSS